MRSSEILIRELSQDQASAKTTETHEQKKEDKREKRTGKKVEMKRGLYSEIYGLGTIP